MSPIFWSWHSWSSIKRSLRFFWQNLIRGWNDSDCWGLDVTFAEFALPRLKRFQEMHGSHPAFKEYPAEEFKLYKKLYAPKYKGKEISSVIWDAMLDRMIDAFELLLDNEYNRHPFRMEPGEKFEVYRKRIDKANAIIDEGLDLFAKHYRHLWD